MVIAKRCAPSAKIPFQKYVKQCLKCENDAKASDCMKRASSSVGVSVAKMRRMCIEKKNTYKRTKGGEQASHNRVAKRKLVEDDCKSRWIHRDGKIVDVNWGGDKAVYCCIAF